jgi:hypothetical protein
MRQRHASEALREGEFPGNKPRPEPDEYGAPADWMGFDEPVRKPAPVVQMPAPVSPGDALGISEGDWKGAARHEAPPPGNHVMVIRSAWSHRPASGGPPVLALIWTPLEGEHQGKTVWQTLAIHAHREEGRKAAVSWLKRIWVAGGCAPERLPRRLEDLQGLVVLATVANKPHWAEPGHTVAYIQAVGKAPDLI